MAVLWTLYKTAVYGSCAKVYSRKHWAICFVGPYKQSPSPPLPHLNTHKGLETLVCDTSNKVDHVIIKYDIPNHHNNLYDVLKIHVLVFRDSFWRSSWRDFLYMLWLSFFIEQVPLSEWQCGSNEYIAESDKYRLKVTDVTGMCKTSYCMLRLSLRLSVPSLNFWYWEWDWDF